MDIILILDNSSCFGLPSIYFQFGHKQLLLFRRITWWLLWKQRTFLRNIMIQNLKGHCLKPICLRLNRFNICKSIIATCWHKKVLNVQYYCLINKPKWRKHGTCFLNTKFINTFPFLKETKCYKINLKFALFKASESSNFLASLLRFNW